MTGMILENPEYEIILSDGGLDALGKLGSDPLIRIVVSDMNMPGISGIKLFTGMQKRGFKLPFVLLTGDDSHRFALNIPTWTSLSLKMRILRRGFQNCGFATG